MAVVCTTADSYIDLVVQGPGCVAEMAASRKEAKYATLQSHYDFSADRGRDSGSFNESATSFPHDLGRRISLVSGDDREPQFLLQRISVAMWCFCTTVFRLDALAKALSVIATAMWLAGWVAGCLSQPVLYQND